MKTHPPPAIDTEFDDALVGEIGSDPDALERFYRTYLLSVERMVARRVADPHSAADMISEVFLAAMRSCKKFDAKRGTPQAWLYGISVRIIADTERRAARRWRAHAREGGRRVLDDDAIARIDAQLDSEAVARALHHEIGRLSRKDRVLLELTAIDGLTIAEAAAVVGITAGAGRVRLHRARTRLQDRLGAHHSVPDATTPINQPHEEKDVTP